MNNRRAKKPLLDELEVSQSKCRALATENPFKETDAFLAEVRAQGVEMLLASLPAYYTARADIAEFAAKLRKGGTSEQN